MFGSARGSVLALIFVLACSGRLEKPEQSPSGATDPGRTRDSGMRMEDAAMPPEDASRDAGAPARDASPSMQDAGHPAREDAASEPADAGHSSDAGTRQEDASTTPPRQCSYEQMMRAGKYAAIGVGPDYCLYYGYQPAEGSAATTGHCAPSGPQRFRFTLHEDDCSYRVDGAWPFDNPTRWCLAHDSSGAVTMAACSAASTQRWNIDEQPDGTFHLRASSGTCLRNAAEDTTAKLGSCDDGHAVIQLAELIAAPPTELHGPDNAAPIAISDTIGGPLALDHSVQAKGFSLGMGAGHTQYVDARADFLVEFAADVAASTDYVLWVVASNSLEGTALDVFVDDAKVGSIDLEVRAGRDELVRSRSLKVALEKGLRKLRLQNHAPFKPFTLDQVATWAPTTRLPKFGAIQQLAAAGITTLERLSVSDLYRINLQHAGTADESWVCLWTHCFVEYSVNAPAAGRYQLTYSYNTQDIETGSLILLAGQKVTSVVYETDSDPTHFRSTDPIPLDLVQGLNRIVIEHGDYLVNGHLSNHYAIQTLTLRAP